MNTSNNDARTRANALRRKRLADWSVVVTVPSVMLEFACAIVGVRHGSVKPIPLRTLVVFKEFSPEFPVFWRMV